MALTVYKYPVICVIEYSNKVLRDYSSLQIYKWSEVTYYSGVDILTRMTREVSAVLKIRKPLDLYVPDIYRYVSTCSVGDYMTVSSPLHSHTCPYMSKSIPGIIFPSYIAVIAN